jgi:hypothetical protein
MALTFNLETIAAEDTLTLSPTYPTVDDDTFSTAVNATADLTGSSAQTVELKGSFHFKLDAKDAADGNVASPDVTYSYTAGKWPELAIGSSTVTVGEMQKVGDDGTADTAPSLAADMVRKIAFDITGGYSASDIFTNEKSLRDHINARDTNVRTAIETILGDQDNINTIGRHLMEKFLNDATRREELFTEIAAKNTAASNTGEGVVCDFPLKANDILVFSVAYTPIKTNLGGGALQKRTYKLQLTLG